MSLVCPVCHASSWDIFYEGPVRVGRFGDWSDGPRTVLKCCGCEVGYLPGDSFDYSGEEYREAVDGCADIAGYWRLHDQDQAEKLTVVGAENLRNAVVADIGCGGGAFLDVAHGLARQTLAVEPCATYHEHLARRHAVRSWCSEAVADFAGQVDIAVSFAVIEHVPDPRAFLEDIRQLLRPGGRLLISTPNADDWLLDLLPTTYGRFFYRKAHSWYFNARSLAAAAEQAGFSASRFIYRQRFDISNALLWVKDGKPTGLGRTPHLGALDGVYRQHLEATGRADFLYAWLDKV